MVRLVVSAVQGQRCLEVRVCVRKALRRVDKVCHVDFSHGAVDAGGYFPFLAVTQRLLVVAESLMALQQLAERQ